MPDTTQTFIAVPVTDRIRSAIERLRARIQPEIEGGRWADSRQFHITLAFLGDVPHANLPEVCRVVADVASRHPPFEITVHGLGAFPNPARPRVLWAGFQGEGVDRLKSLQSDLEQNLRAAGYPPDDRFSPHITLARFKPSKHSAVDLTDIVDRHAARWKAGELPCREIIAYSSTLDDDGPVYTVLTRGTLGKKS